MSITRAATGISTLICNTSCRRDIGEFCCFKQLVDNPSFTDTGLAGVFVPLLLRPQDQESSQKQDDRSAESHSRNVTVNPASRIRKPARRGFPLRMIRGITLSRN